VSVVILCKNEHMRFQDVTNLTRTFIELVNVFDLLGIYAELVCMYLLTFGTACRSHPQGSSGLREMLIISLFVVLRGIVWAVFGWQRKIECTHGINRACSKSAEMSEL
jgi:hypothetical protein